jgi:hypothetical protein
LRDTTNSTELRENIIKIGSGEIGCGEEGFAGQ